MQRYDEPHDSHEREPLDAPNTHHVYSPPEVPYYDTSPPPHPAATTSYGQGQASYDHDTPPPPPQHRSSSVQTRGRSNQQGADATGYAPAQRTAPSTVTPGADNFSQSAAGGMASIAYGVAERNARESGVSAMQEPATLPPPPSHARYPNSYNQDIERGSRPSSFNPLGMPAVAPGSRSPSRSARHDPYADDPYQVYSSTPRNNNSMLGIVDPNDIIDDGDDGLDYSRRSHRTSTLSASNSDRGTKTAATAAMAVGGAAAAGGMIGSALGRNGSGEPPSYDASAAKEKSSGWLDNQTSKSKKWRWAIIIAVFLVIVGAIVGAVVGTVVKNHKHNGGGKSSGSSGSSGGSGGSGSDGSSASDDSNKNGDLDINSQEIQDLLNNQDLHKVFPGIDYTPLNTQYPDCLNNPPSQNNITRDVAVLSQLTNKIRLYGTDCNQTEMLLHSISQLEMKNDVKVWLGVWQDNNHTTNARQLDQMWTILDTYGADPFEGIIVANEVLFRQQFTVTSLGDLLDSVRQNLTKKSIDLPVATSDLGDDWTSALGQESDYIMANVHPFFAGVTADKAAAWTYNFWQQKDGPFWKTDKSKNIISETGWPSGGGKDCGGPSTCTDPAVAGIDEMNTFMNDWVCQALQNGTNYFWFEAFDEPWKVQFNTPGEEWEDKWGLMDADRKLKDGVKIPDCGGKTVS